MAQADQWWPEDRGGGRGLTRKGQEGTFQGDGAVLDLDGCDDRESVYSCQRSLKCALKTEIAFSVHYSSRKLIFKRSPPSWGLHTSEGGETENEQSQHKI